MAAGDRGAVQFFTGADADDGDYTTALVAASTGQKIRVTSLVITVLTTAGVVSLKTGSTVIFQAHLALGTPLVIVNPGGICETTAGAALVANNGGGVDSFINGTFVTVET